MVGEKGLVGKLEMGGGGVAGSYIQWAEIDTERKRWIGGGRKIVRDSALYIAG